MGSRVSREFGQSILRTFYYEFRRDILGSRALIVLCVFVMFDLMMLLSFGYILTAETTDSERLPAAFEDPTAESWGNISIVLSGAFYYSLLGLGAASFIGAGALARDLKSGALRLVQATPTSREATYIGRNISAFIVSYLLAAIGSTFMMVGFIILAGFADVDMAATAEIMIEFGLKIQLVIAISILVAITTTAALGIITRSHTIGAIGGISFFILIDAFLGIGATLFPEEWHLENLSFGFHQGEIMRWLIGKFDVNYVRYGTISIPWGSIAVLLAIPIVATAIGLYFYRTMDLD